MSSTVNIRDYILKNPETEEKTSVANSKTRKYAKYSLTFASGTDFIVRKETPRTNYSLVIIVSQGQYYIKNEDTDEITMLDFADHGTLLASAELLTKFFTDNIEENSNSVIPDNITWLYSFPRGKKQCEVFLQTLNHCAAFLKYDVVSLNDITYEYFARTYGYQTIKSYVPEITKNLDIIKEMRAAFSYVDSNTFATTTFQGLTHRGKYYSSTCDNEALAMLSTFYPFLAWVKSTFGIENLRDFIAAYKELPVFPHLCKDYALADFVKEIGVCEYKKMRDYALYENVSQGYAMHSSGIFSEWTDTLRMERIVFKKIREKYPEYLASLHEKLSYIVARNKESYDFELWKAIKDSSKNLEWKGKQYFTVFPEDKAALLDEATQQSNCVAGYFNSVLNGRCKIILLRQNKKPDASWVTIEVRDDKIVQAKMKFNRRLNSEAQIAIAKYADACKLQITCEL